MFYHTLTELSRWLSGKESACQLGFSPWVGKIPGVGNGNPLQYSCLGNLMERGAGVLQFTALQRVGRNWACTHTLTVLLYCMLIYTLFFCYLYLYFSLIFQAPNIVNRSITIMIFIYCIWKGLPNISSLDLFFFGGYLIGIYNRHKLWVHRKLGIVVTVEAELFTVVAVTGKVH